MLYDKHRGQPAANIPATVSADDVQAFCRAYHVGFHAMGRVDDWNDQSFFRASTHEYPSRGQDIPFSKVIEWKAALADIGPQVLEGGHYLSFSGEHVTTMCEALDPSDVPVVVFRNDTGQIRTAPKNHFFAVHNHKGTLVARFAYQEPVPA